MPTGKSVRIQDHFARPTDPRRRAVIYPLINVVVIAICAVSCGADDFVAIARFGRTKRAWFERLLGLRAGIPSHERFNAVFGAIKPAEFEKCFLSWITALHELTGGQVIAIDRKTRRRSFDAATSRAAIHMVGAWATMSSISLGQYVVDAKSNEITAIPQLLQMLELSGALVTIDAMGCQTAIAEQIVDAAASYCLAVKRNQPNLSEGIKNFFNDQMADEFARTKVRRHETTEKGHGRVEQRCYYICPVPGELPDRGGWAQLKAIGMGRTITQRKGQESAEVRDYILSEYLAGCRFGEAVRGHWGIENRLHWQLDVTFQEDQCRIRKGPADANFSILRRAALSMLKNETSLKVGIKNKHLTAGWDETYLEKGLLGS